MPSLGRKMSRLKMTDDSRPPEKKSSEKPEDKKRRKRSEAKNRIRDSYNKMKKDKGY